MAQTDIPIRTKVFRPSEDGRPVLLCFVSSGHHADWPLGQGEHTMGRLGSGATFEVPSAVVSRHHGVFGCRGGKVVYRDVGSTNGTLVNGRPCAGEVVLHDGDILSVVPRHSPGTPTCKLVFTHVRSGGLTWRAIDLNDGVREVRIGRGEGDLGISDEFVSRQHVSFLPRGRELHVFDLGSTNGVYLEGRRVSRSALVPDLGIVRIGNTWACFAYSRLWVGTEQAVASRSAVEPSLGRREPPRRAYDRVEPQPRMPAQRHEPPGGGYRPRREEPPRTPRRPGPVLHIDIQQKVVGARGRRRLLLKDVRADIDQGDFVLVLGGSGAGKSTFLKAVMGYDRADGSIRYGDIDVYDEYDRIKYDIGYVPQENLVRKDDTVRDTLVSAARLRMSPRLPARKYEEAAERVGRELGLEAVQDNLVGRVSGGQLRRVCIGCELVGDPSLLFLDEPDSGLDEPVARGIRRDLRRVADAGKIVMVVTHSPDIEAELFTKVLVIAKCSDGVGHLLFCGPPHEARAFFGVRQLSDVVGRVNSPEENGDGLADVYLDKWRRQRRG